MKFIILLPPKAQARHRTRAFTTKKGKLAVQAYDSKETRLDNEQLWAMLLPHRPPEPLSGALCLEINAYLGIPKSFSKKKAAAALSGTLRPITKPDLDNLAKKLKDRMNKIFYQDDAQVVSLTVRKFYGTPPRWEVEILPA